MPDLQKTREMCGEWDEYLEECGEGYPEACPFRGECRKDAEEDEK